MNSNLENILEDGEVEIYILKHVIDVMENIKDLEVKTSNGLSHVFITPELNHVYQYFKNISSVDKIKKLFNIIDPEIVNHFYITGHEKVKYSYNIYKYISNIHTLKNFNDPNIIVWKKINCLNSFDGESKINIILKNHIKLLWDISKALYGLHINNIYHGDARIDNIGIYNNNFILFDFDGSSLESSNFNFNKDIHDFKTSIKYNLEKEYNDIKNLMDNFTTGKELMNFLVSKYLIEKNSIKEVIEYLDNLEIIY
jgi:tRNA A-37 threonylcarbamoyl transferase component Bud32